jgi:CBS-domain-containing membrane protein
MRAMDVMTTEVISVDPDTSVQALAALFWERGISGAPVVDADHRVVGIVSEVGLLHRVETATERQPEARTVAGGHGGSTRSLPTGSLPATMSSRTAARSGTL